MDFITPLVGATMTTNPFGTMVISGVALATNLFFATNVGSFHREIEKYQLPIPPLAGEHVRVCHYGPERSSFYLTLTNGWRLAFDYGKLTSFESPVGTKPQLGAVDMTNAIMTEAEAIELARHYARKTGLTDREMYLHLAPQVAADAGIIKKLIVSL